MRRRESVPFAHPASIATLNSPDNKEIFTGIDKSTTHDDIGALKARTGRFLLTKLDFG